MADVILSPQALTDLQRLYDWIADANPNAADETVRNLDALFRRLARFPRK